MPPGAFPSTVVLCELCQDLHIMGERPHIGQVSTWGSMVSKKIKQSDIGLEHCLDCSMGLNSFFFFSINT